MKKLFVLALAVMALTAITALAGGTRGVSVSRSGVYAGSYYSRPLVVGSSYGCAAPAYVSPVYAAPLVSYSAPLVAAPVYAPPVVAAVVAPVVDAYPAVYAAPLVSPVYQTYPYYNRSFLRTRGFIRR